MDHTKYKINWYSRYGLSLFISHSLFSFSLNANLVNAFFQTISPEFVGVRRVCFCCCLSSNEASAMWIIDRSHLVFCKQEKLRLLSVVSFRVCLCAMLWKNAFLILKRKSCGSRECFCCNFCVQIFNHDDNCRFLLAFVYNASLCFNRANLQGSAVSSSLLFFLFSSFLRKQKGLFLCLLISICVVFIEKLVIALWYFKHKVPFEAWSLSPWVRKLTQTKYKLWSTKNDNIIKLVINETVQRLIATILWMFPPHAPCPKDLSLG